MDGAAHNDEISDWRGAFRSYGLEQQFRSHVQPQTARQTRSSAVVAATTFAAFGISDYALLGDGPALVGLLALRGTVVAVCLLLIAAVRRRPELVDRVWPTNLAIAVGITGIILIVPLRPHTIDTQAPAVMVAVAAIYLFLPNRIPWMMLQGAFLSVGFLGAAVACSALPPDTLVTHSLLLVFVNTVGLITAMRLSRLRRVQFATLLEEREMNDRLQSEIAARRHLEARLTRMARTDELTGLHNRRRLFELAQQSLRQARRTGAALSVAMIDLDRFKAINDRFGHRVGDQALVAVADCCREVLRESDLLGRFGGEEFVAVLPDTTQSQAYEMAQRLRHRVAGLGERDFGVDMHVTVTIGVSQVNQAERTIEQALHRADGALYDGKRQGRDRVVAATPARDAEAADNQEGDTTDA